VGAISKTCDPSQPGIWGTVTPAGFRGVEAQPLVESWDLFLLHREAENFEEIARGCKLNTVKNAYL